MLVRTLLVVALVANAHADIWDPVRKHLSSFPLDDFCFSVGDASGTLFTQCIGNITMDQPLVMASSSKFPTANAIMGVVADPSNDLAFDSLASDFLSYWTKDPANPRSRVTLRNLLTFTSGFFSKDAGGDLACLSFTSNVSFMDCVESIYDSAPFTEPDMQWDYNSFHLQVAGGMAAAAANTTMIGVLEKYLLQPLNLTESHYINPTNPYLAAGLVTTGTDYGKFLWNYLTYNACPKSLADEMEKNAVVAPIVASNASWYLLDILGSYSMANYFQCLPPKKAAFTAECEAASVHADPGLFGYWPLVDRVNNYYLQIVQEKHKPFAGGLGPTVKASVLLGLVKPLVDGIVVNGTASPASRDAAALLAAAAAHHGWQKYAQASAAFVASHPELEL